MMILLSAQPVRADQINYRGFYFLDAKQGLSDNIVSDIGQDNQGFMWFSTQKGLNRYDGYDIKVYNPAAESSIDTPVPIRGLLTARDNRIWLAILDGGAVVFDPGTEEFTDLGFLDPDSLLSGDWKIRDMSEGLDGTIWLSSDGNGVLRIEPPTNDHPLSGEWIRDLPLVGDRLRSLCATTTGTVWVGSQKGEIMVLDAQGTLIHSTSLPIALRESGLNLFDIFEARNGTIWISSDIGLFRHDRRSDSFDLLQPSPQPDSSTSNSLTGAAEDSSGILWIGSYEGLYRFDPLTEQFELFPHNPADPGSPIRGPVTKTFCGTSGMVWASCWYSGILKYDTHAINFRIENANPMDPHSLAESSVQALFEDSDGTLWVGTGYRGPGNSTGVIHRRTPDTPGFDRWYFPDHRVTSVEAIIRDDEGQLWIGTNSGLWRFAEGSAAPLVRAEGESGSGEAQVIVLNTAANGDLWVGTFGKGLFVRNRETGELRHFETNPNDKRSRFDHKIATIQNDFQGRTWVGTDGGGLLLYSKATDSFQRFLQEENILNSILSIIPLTDGGFYLGTYGGLVKFHPERGISQVFNRSSGLSNDAVTQGVVDDSGNCWISISTGIVRLEMDSGSIREFSNKDGMGEFGGCFTAIRRRSGTLLFGGPGGIVEFDPARFSPNEYLPPVVFSNIEVNGQSVKEKSNSKPATNREPIRRLELAHDQNNIALSFSALDYTSSNGILYRHRLEGFDDHWSDPSQTRTAYYTNLDPGVYHFGVLASNSHRLWNTDETQITIVIRKPWWTTWPALAGYFLMAVLFLLLAQRQQAARELAKRNVALNRAKTEHLVQMSEVKSKFLGNVAHEFLGPLTVIKNLVLSGDSPDKDVRFRSRVMMERNTIHLENLTKQLVALSSLETGGVDINRTKGFTVEALGDLISMYRAIAKQRGIHFKDHITNDKGEGWMDFDLLESIFSNLLDNTIKSTDYRGTIEVVISLDRDMKRLSSLNKNNTEDKKPGGQGFWLVVKITHTDSLNVTRDLEKAFERFYTAAPNKLNQTRGSGIGLALVKEFTLVLGGKVSAKAVGDNSTRFQVELPVLESRAAIDVLDVETRQVGSKGTISTEVNKSRPVKRKVIEEPLFDGSDSELNTPGQDLKTILVIDQDPDMRSFLRYKFAGDFNFIEAVNGSSGLEIVSAKLPDLILCEQRLDDMRGDEFCAKIKHKWRTQSIPVIIFFTGDDKKFRLSAFKAGADDFIQKPYNINEVHARIINLIQQKDRITGKHKDQQAQSTNPLTVGLLGSEDEFLTQLNLIVERNLHDPNFRIENLASQLFMSRSTLHRKILAMTGHSSSDYLRNRRLHRATQILSQSQHSVMEVSMAVGYKNPSNFSRAFRDLFGTSPSQYRKTGL